MAFSFFARWMAPPMSLAARTTFVFLQQLQVPVTRTGLQEAWDKEPGPASLYRISRQLDHLKVDALCLEAEPARLNDLPLPFIAHFGNANRLLVVTHIQKDYITYYDEHEVKQELPRQQFLEEWSGHVLLAEKREGAGEKDYARHRKKEKAALRQRLALPFTFLLYAIGALLINSGGPWLTCLLLVKWVGCLISGLLLLLETDQHHPLAQAFCSGSKSGCTKLASSKSISWSGVGLFYFTAGLFSLAISNKPGALSFHSILSTLSLLFIPYSIYYQLRIAKAWCPLCLSVLALLFIEFVLAWNFYWRVGATTDSIMNYALAASPFFVIALLLTIVMRKLLQSSRESGSYRRRMQLLQYDPAVFLALLSKEKEVTVPPGLGLVSGPGDAWCTITQVCHPFCRPCARAHEAIEDLMHEQTGIRLQTVFNVTTEPGDAGANPVAYFLGLQAYGHPSPDEIVSDWYREGYRDSNAFFARHPVLPPMPQEEQIGAMLRWCRQKGIEATPTLFINGRQLPSIYTADSLRYLLHPSIFATTTGVCV